MIRLNRYTAIQDIIQWVIKIPRSSVSFIYKRNSNGFEYFTGFHHSTYSTGKRVFMIVEELLSICKHAEAWSMKVLNQPKTVISRSDGKQLTLAFSEYLNTYSMEIRIWRMCSETGVYEPTSYGFYINGLPQIKYLSEVRKNCLLYTSPSPRDS